MTRFSDALLAFALLASPAVAQEWQADAFGLYDPATTSPDRPQWAGLVTDATGGQPRTVAPGAPDRLIVLAGPKSLVAGKDPGHVVGFAVDALGNAVADGTPALVTVNGQPSPTQTHGGLADLLLPPQTQAISLIAGVSVADRQSPRAQMDVTADLASVQPRLAGPLPQPAADSPFQITTAPLQDRFGNPVPDGTGASLVITHADGSFSLAPAMALQEAAQSHLIARDMAGQGQARLTLGAQGSDSLALTVTLPQPQGLPALELQPLPDIAASRLTLGPFVTTQGFALNDGAQISLSLQAANGTLWAETAWILDGEAQFLLPLPADTPIRRLTVQSTLGPMDLTAAWQRAVPQGAAP